MIIYIASRYSAKTQEQFDKQMEATKSISREVVLAGHEVIVPHLYYPLFLNDDDIAERLVGTQSAIKLLDVCDLLVVYVGLGISSGMRAEIETARQKGMQIYHFDDVSKVRERLCKLN